MGRGVSKLGARTEVRVHRHDASKCRCGRPFDLGGDSEPGGHALPRLQQATTEDLQAKACIAEPVANRFDTCGQLCFSANQTRSRGCLRDSKASGERKNRKRHDPEPSAEIAAVEHDAEGADQRHAYEHRPCARLRLRADEQPTQPGTCDPRKHQARPSKGHARRKQPAERSNSSARLASAGGRVAGRHALG